MVVDVYGEAELAGQEDGATGEVVEQDRGPVAAVVGLALLGFPASVAAAIVERRAAQDVPAVGGDLDVADDDIGVAVEAATALVEAGAPAPVGDVDSYAGLLVGQAAIIAQGAWPTTAAARGSRRGWPVGPQV
jgi:hypothetical protein